VRRKLIALLDNTSFMLFYFSIVVVLGCSFQNIYSNLSLYFLLNAHMFVNLLLFLLDWVNSFVTHVYTVILTRVILINL